jgi:hypothetical protein
MQNVVSAGLAVGMIGLICALLASFYFLGRLIRYEYAYHRDEWERDGRPNAPFFRPPETTWFRSGLAYQRCALSWPLYTPLWMRADPAAKVLHSRLWSCVLIWNLGLIIWILLFVWCLAATPSIQRGDADMWLGQVCFLIKRCMGDFLFPLEEGFGEPWFPTLERRDFLG